jgi:TRAP-type C4-dicarboxylate transport system permease large subunit
MGTISGLDVSKYAVLILVTIVYLILGCFFDGISLMLMTLPLVFPVMAGVGFDPVWTGVFITVMIEIGMLTPPVGMNLYVLVEITNREVSLGEAARASLPYWALMLVGVLVLTLFPGIAHLLPDQVMGR